MLFSNIADELFTIFNKLPTTCETFKAVMKFDFFIYCCKNF